MCTRRDVTELHWEFPTWQNDVRKAHLARDRSSSNKMWIIFLHLNRRTGNFTVNSASYPQQVKNK